MDKKAKARGESYLKQQIYLDLKRKLIDCTFPPGSELNELLLAEEYNVSRTPVREAVSQLELEGYVRVIPKKGICVSDISIEDAVKIFQTRIEIEPLTLRMAFPYLDIGRLMDFRRLFENEQENEVLLSTRLDMDMHIYLVDCCRNSYLIDMMHRLFDDNLRMIIASGLNTVRVHNARMEHLAILNSLIANYDVETSARLLRSHIETCRAATLNYFSTEEYSRRIGKGS